MGVNDFDEIAHIWDQLPIAANQGADIFVDRAPQTKGKALDLGCGTGSTIIALSEIFDEVVGIDVSPVMIKVAQKKIEESGIRNIQLINERMQNVKIPCCDYIISHTAFHHLSMGQIYAFLPTLRESLSPNGKLLILDWMSDSFKIRPDWSRRIATIVDVLKNVRHPIKAYRDYKIGTNPVWMEHIRSDQYHDSEEFSNVVRQTFPDAVFEWLPREYGLAKILVCEWLGPEASYRSWADPA